MNFALGMNRKEIKEAFRRWRIRGKPKIFCIGRNKTGTTSIAKAFKELGYTVGKQRPAQMLVREYVRRDFGLIVEYCHSAQVFQDAPFSFPETYKYMDLAFPGSKFILTVRSSAEEWYDSLIRFHSLRFGGGKVPTAEDLKNAPNIWKGRAWETNRALYDSPEDDPYNKEILTAHYENHNRVIREYFRDRPNDFIEINVARRGDYQRLMQFMGIRSSKECFPWKNSTVSVKKALKGTKAKDR